jgi:hypothetical protein
LHWRRYWFGTALHLSTVSYRVWCVIALEQVLVWDSFTFKNSQLQGLVCYCIRAGTGLGELYTSARSVTGFGVLVHWSRYWFGTALHLSTVSYRVCCVIALEQVLVWDSFTVKHGQLQTYMLPRCTETQTSNSSVDITAWWVSRPELVPVTGGIVCV